MLRHWNRLLPRERDPDRRRRMHRARAINAFGMVLTGTRARHRARHQVHPRGVDRDRRDGRHLPGDAAASAATTTRSPASSTATVRSRCCPARNHAVVLVSKVHQPTLRAVAYAQATRPDTLTALTVNVDEGDTRRLQAAWESHDVPVPLTVVESPYREITGPDHRLREVPASQRSPRDVVTVFIPEYVVGRWWEHLLHNQSALRLKGRLLFEPGVMVTSVPWQLASTATKDLARLDKSLRRTVPRGPAPASTGKQHRKRRTPRREQPQKGPSVTYQRGDPYTAPDDGKVPLHVLEVGPVAHGGHCVARTDEGQVVFVRHALPGERVRAQVTEHRKAFLRADAVEVLRPSPDRVTPPCPWAGPDRCGGCDFQHASLPAQRELKAAVVREQLTRLARAEPGRGRGPGRTGAGAARGGRGARRPGLADPDAVHSGLRWPGRTAEAPLARGGAGGLVPHRPSGGPGGHGRRRRRPRPGVARPGRGRGGGPGRRGGRGAGAAWAVPAGAGLRARHGDRARGRVGVAAAGGGVLAGASGRGRHAGAPRWSSCSRPRRGERAWDLYGGAGLFAAALARTWTGRAG